LLYSCVRSTAVDAKIVKETAMSQQSSLAKPCRMPIFTEDFCAADPSRRVLEISIGGAGDFFPACSRRRAFSLAASRGEQ
jgi:hypothetical protein